MDITKAKEFLFKQGLDDCHYKDSAMIEHIAEQMEMYHAEQLRLDAVRLSFDELTDAMIKYNAKSEYKQAAIVILRKIFESHKA